METWQPDDPKTCERCGRTNALVRRRINRPGRPCLCPTCNDEQTGEVACAA